MAVTCTFCGNVSETLADASWHYNQTHRQITPRCPACEAAARERDDLHTLCDRQADILSRVAVALRGLEPPLTRWSHHDLPERAERAVRELADLRARLEVLADELPARHWPRTSDAGSAAEQIAGELRAELRKEAK